MLHSFSSDEGFTTLHEYIFFCVWLVALFFFPEFNYMEVLTFCTFSSMQCSPETPKTMSAISCEWESISWAACVSVRAHE